MTIFVSIYGGVTVKSKKIFSFILLFVMLISVCCGSFVSSASVYYVDGQPKTMPGQTKVYVPIENFNYAWADDIVVRDSSSSVTPLTLIPLTDNPYSHTLEEFVEECNNYTSLFNASEEVLESTFVTSLRTMYYTLIATGVIKENNTDMRKYNEEHGIVYPFVESDLTQIYTALVYVSLRTDLYSAILDEQIDIPRGTTVEGAIVAILSKVCKMEVPATVDSLSTFAYLFAEDYVLEEEKFPISENPTESEVYYWIQLAAADNAGYSVPVDVPYGSISKEQQEYVTYAYYASILTNKYEVMIDPLLLRAALLSSEKETKVPMLVLKAMLDDVSVSYSKNESSSSLFEKAKAEGFFDLENEFYTDIYKYEVHVTPENEKIWFTTYLVANQLVDGNVDNAKTYINGELVNNTTTVDVALIEGTVTKVVIDITYYDGGRNDKASYTFNIIKDSNASDINGNLSIDVGDPVNSVLGSLSDSADNYLAGFDLPTLPNPTKAEGSSSNHTTYAINGATDSGSKFETYPTDENNNIINNANALSTTKAEEQTTIQVLDKSLAQTVKENPEYVATPIVLLSFGASAGYIFFRKRTEDEYNLANDDVEVDDIDID